MSTQNKQKIKLYDPPNISRRDISILKVNSQIVNKFMKSLIVKLLQKYNRWDGLKLHEEKV